MKNCSKPIHTNPYLNIVCALSIEARALIDYFKLRKKYTRPFVIFVNEMQTIHLIIAGVGQVAMAAACGYLQQLTGNKPYATWLNIGIAGGDAPLGSLWLIDKITDQVLGYACYPSVGGFIANVRGLDIRLGALMTVAKPQVDYHVDQLFDMEAYAFFAVVRKFVCQEQILVLKIISDQSVNDQNNLTKQHVLALFKQNLNKIKAMIDQLCMLSAQEAALLPDEGVFNNFIVKHHFTQTEQHQLRELLRRWQAIYADNDPHALCAQAPSGKAVLQKLTAVLA